MKKLGLDFAGWLWAINRDKVKEYYAENYGGGAIEFKNWIGGQIVKQFFYESPKLLEKAYRLLHFNWNMLVWNEYPKAQKGFITTVEVTFHDISWLMFKALAYHLEKDFISKITVSGWQKLWNELDTKYKIE